MRKTHYLAIASAVGLIAILYFGTNTTPPRKTAEATPVAEPGKPQNVKPASFNSVLSAAKASLPAHAADDINTIENELNAIRDSSKMAFLFVKLGQTWMQHKQELVAAEYFALAGKLENSEKNLTFAGRMYLEQARKAESESIQAWAAQQATEVFKKITELNPANDSAKINLAECYIGTGETMQGVLLLREITTKDPDNVPANLILGQQGIVSGQLDKAVLRFESVLRKEPENMEGILGLAEAFKGKGEKQKAIDLLEKAKKLMNNPDFSKDIDNYIKSFK